jgi:hypothetical protein
MSQNYGANIITDNLAMHVDPANPKSYPGTGTTVYDLSGNSKNGSLIGGTSYNASNNGTFYFDGVNGVINFGTGSTFFPLTNFAIDMWFSSDGTTPTTGTSPGLFGGTYGMRLFVGSSALSFYLDSGTAFPGISSPSSYSFYNSSWHHVVAQSTANTMSLYIDGSLAVSSSITTWLGITRWPTNSFNFGQDNNNVMYYFRGKMGPIKMYRRVLTATEVTQNFNAVRGRYGL